MMKRCDDSNWLSLCSQGNEVALLESDRLQTLTNYTHHPSIQKPSLLVLIGNASKSVALRELFGVKRARSFRNKRTFGEIHLHLDPSTIFSGRPIFLADADFPRQNLSARSTTAAKCHETTRHTIQWSTDSSGASLRGIAVSIYTHLLFPFADTFCFFSADLGGFRQIAIHIATWLEKGSSSTLPKCTYPRVIIVSDKIPPGTVSENEARRAFLWMLSEETTKDPFKQVSAIDIIALFSTGTMSVKARHRLLKERLMDASDQIRSSREKTRYLFSATHFSALFKYACAHLAKSIEQPFNLIKASRMYNPVAPDLEEHLSTFLKHINNPRELTDFAAPVISSSFLLDNYPPGAHMFDAEGVFRVLYRDILHRMSDSRVMAFEESSDVILRSGFINLVEKRFLEYFSQSNELHGKSPAEIHGANLERFQDQWHNIRSDSTCFPCLRRRPQYNQKCGHCICHTCVMNFGEQSTDDPWDFKVRQCFLCKTKLPEEVVVREHPPTAGVGVLCLDGGGIRGIMSLALMKRIRDRIDLPIPFQKFFKVTFGVSSALINLAMFHNGWSIEKSSETFEKLAKLAFKRRKFLTIPFFSRIQELVVWYFTDGLYPAANIEAALKEVFGTERSILDYSYATSIGTKIGLPVATVKEKPSSRIFTNYNGIGLRGKNLANHVIRPKDGFGNVLVWEIARAASAAPGFFPTKHIQGVGTFQDAGPLENDPLVSALSEVASIFPLIEEPDFILSLGTGEPKEDDTCVNGASEQENDDTCTNGTPSTWKNKAFPRLCRMFWEKMRDRKIRQAFQMHPRYHRLNSELDLTEPRLDEAKSMPALRLKVQADDSISKKIDSIARCMVASLFYFELDSIPDRIDGKSVGIGYIQCFLRDNSPAFSLLLRQLSQCSAVFYLDDCPVPGRLGDNSFLGTDGNFRKRVELDVADRFTISLKQGHSERCNISGSSYSIRKLILAQGLDAHFGTADHRKRKRSEESAFRERKRQRI